MLSHSISTSLTEPLVKDSSLESTDLQQGLLGPAENHAGSVPDPDTPQNNLSSPSTAKSTGGRKSKKTTPRPRKKSSPQKLALEENNLQETETTIIPPTNNVAATEGRKRSRKQQINTLLDPSSSSPPVVTLDKKKKRQKKVNQSNTAPEEQKSSPAPTKTNTKKHKKGANSDSNLESTLKIESVKSLAPSKVKSAVPSASALVKRAKSSSTGAVNKKVNNNIDSKPKPEQRIVLKRSEFIDPRLAFQVFHDSSRNTSAIGPSQVVVTVGDVVVPGTLLDLELHKSDSDYPECEPFPYSKYLSRPHYLPLTTVHTSGAPFARVLKYSQLEELTGGVQLKTKNVVTHRYRLPGSALLSSSERNEGYPPNTIVVKHPVLRRHSKIPVSLKFFVLKTIQKQRKTVGVVRGRVVHLKRTEDFNNIQILLEECSIPEIPRDANAMNQQNIQPVLHAESGLVAVLDRSSSYLQQSQQQQHYLHQPPIQINPPTYHQPNHPATFQFVPYRYDQAATLVYDPEPVAPSNNTALITSSYSSSANNQHVSLNDGQPEFVSTLNRLQEESGAQILVLANSDIQFNPNSAQLHQIQPSQLVVHHPHGESSHNTSVPQPVPVQYLQEPHYYITNNQPSLGLVKQFQSTGQTVQNQTITLNNKEYRIQLEHPGASVAIANQPPLLNSQVQVRRENQQIRHVSFQGQSQIQTQQKQVIIQRPDQGGVVIQELQQTSTTQVQQPGRLIQVIQQGARPRSPQLTPQRQYPPQSVILGTGQVQTQISNQQQISCIQQTPQQQQVVRVVQQTLPQVPQQEPPRPQYQYQSVIQKVHQYQPNTQPQLQSQSFQQQVQPNVVDTKPLLPPQTFPVSTPNRGYQVQVQQLQSPAVPPAPTGTVTLPTKSPKPKPKKEPKNRKNSGQLQGPAPSLVSSTPSTSGTPSTPSPSGKPITPDFVRVPADSSLPNSGAQSAGKVGSCSQSSAGANSPRKVIVITGSTQPNSNGSTTSTTSAVNQLPDRPTRKPGYLAVCPHCGSSGLNIVKCSRCGVDFPESVKLIKDNWSLNNSGVVVPKPVVIKRTEGADKPPETKKVSAPEKPVVVKKAPPQKKILLINKPAILKGISTVQVKIEKDGGSTVTVVRSESGVPSLPKSKPIPKKRAPPRKKQQVCITLSSDEEEPEEPAPKVAKIENSEGSTEGVASGEKQEVVSGEGDKTLDTSQASGSTAEEEMARKKLSINLSPEEDLKPQLEESEVCPEQVLEKIESEMNVPGSKFQFATIECRSIRVGSYKVTKDDTCNRAIIATLTNLGMTFSLPFSNSRVLMKKICIPCEQMIYLKGNLTRKLPAIFIQTGPRFAKWIRDILGLTGTPENESSNYYCPVNGSPCQRAITLLPENFTDQDVGLIRNMYKDKLLELDVPTTNQYLMDVTPQSFKSSIDFKPADAASPANTISARPKVGASASTRTSNPLPAPSTSAGALEQDSEATLFFYEAKGFKIPISPKDISCLAYGQFLNDQIIDFWLAVIQAEIFSEEDRKRTFVFDSFFYSKLTEKKKCHEDSNLPAAERRHARVKKRTKNVDIFEKDFLIVPINENFHWFIAVICFPGLKGYHDYDTLEPLPNYVSKATKKRTSVTAKNKPIVSTQPQNDTTASYSNRDEAPGDPDEDGQATPETISNEDSQSPLPNQKAASKGDRKQSENKQTKTESSSPEQRVKRPCILIFDSLASDVRSRIYATLREYLKMEHKTRKNAEIVLDKNTMPGIMPKVPQQPNYSDCGLFMLQYIECLFRNPIHTYDIGKELILLDWFSQSIAANKRRELFDFIRNQIEEKSPQNLARIPDVNFEPTSDCEDGNIMDEEDEDDDDEDYNSGMETDDEDEDLFSPAAPKKAKVEIEATSAASKEVKEEPPTSTPITTVAEAEEAAATTTTTSVNPAPAPAAVTNSISTSSSTTSTTGVPPSPFKPTTSGSVVVSLMIPTTTK